MKRSLILAIALALGLFSACHSPLATFSEPQPKGAKNLDNIPNRIQGKYRSVADSTILLVGDQAIIKYYADSTGILSYADTLFHLQRGDILRKFKGYYFLNIPRAANSWEVKKLALHKRGIVSIGEIASADEINKLIALTDIPQDSANGKVFDPSRKEFKEFIKSEGFSSQENYVRVE